MNQSTNSFNSLEIAIEKLALEIMNLRSTLLENKRRKARLVEWKNNHPKELVDTYKEQFYSVDLKGEDSLGYDRYGRDIFVGDIVGLLSPSKTGLFKGERFGIVLNKIKQNSEDIYIGKINDKTVATKREPHNLQVVSACEDDDIDIQIKNINFQLVKMVKKKDLYEHWKKNKSIGLDKNKNPIYIHDIVKFQRQSKTGPFKGEMFGVAIKNSQTNKRQILIGKLDNKSVTTKREPYNVQVVTDMVEYNWVTKKESDELLSKYFKEYE